MLRIAAILFQFLGGVALTLVGLVSLSDRVDWRGLINENHWGKIGIDDGNVVLAYALRSDRAVSTHRYRVRLGLLGRAGFATGTSFREWQYATLTLPLWAMVGFLFVHPTVTYVRGPLRRRVRRKRGCCAGCGYDLRASIGAVCPECGMAA